LAPGGGGGGGGGGGAPARHGAAQIGTANAQRESTDAGQGRPRPPRAAAARRGVAIEACDGNGGRPRGPTRGGGEYRREVGFPPDLTTGDQRGGETAGSCGDAEGQRPAAASAVGLKPCTLQICSFAAISCCRVPADLEK